MCMLLLRPIANTHALPFQITVLIYAIDTLYSLALHYVQCLQYLHGEYERGKI